MGIRLSFRKKGTSSGEACLGKLYHYLESKEEIESCKSIKYLLEVGALDGLFGAYEDDFYEWDRSDAEKFAEICDWAPYQEYGEFFELTKAQMRIFLELYNEDQARCWGRDKWDMREYYDFMDEYTSLETSIFEFRQGA